MRASLATALLNEGNDFPTIQQVLGQSSIRSTKHYVKVAIENLRVVALEVQAPAGNFKALLEGGAA